MQTHALGDNRLSARLVKSMGLLASFPGHAMTGNPTPDQAAVKGYYRLVDRPDESQVTPLNILAAAPRAHDRADARPGGRFYASRTGPT